MRKREEAKKRQRARECIGNRPRLTQGTVPFYPKQKSGRTNDI